MHCEICGDTPVTKTLAGLAFACENCCATLRPAAPPRLDICQNCNRTDNAGSWGNGLDGRRLCNTHYTQEPQPAEYCRARAQLILAKAVAMDPAIGRRHTGPTNDPLWLDQVTAALAKWGATPLFEPTHRLEQDSGNSP